MREPKGSLTLPPFHVMLGGYIPIPHTQSDTFCTGYLSWARNACLYVKPIGRLKSTFHRAQRGGQYPIWNRTVEKILFLYCKWPISKHSVERREPLGSLKIK